MQRVSVAATAVLRFCLDAERCLAGISGADGAVMMNDLIGHDPHPKALDNPATLTWDMWSGNYMVPGGKDCIWPLLGGKVMEALRHVLRCAIWEWDVLTPP